MPKNLAPQKYKNRLTIETYVLTDCLIVFSTVYQPVAGNLTPENIFIFYEFFG